MVLGNDSSDEIRVDDTPSWFNSISNVTTFKTYGNTGSGAWVFRDSAAGTNIMTILASGNVGIGTTNPGNYKLYVNGDTYIGGVTVTNGALTFGGDLNMQGYKINNVSNIGIGTSLPGSAALAVMVGNVGIGTTLPTTKLDVVGQARLNYNGTSNVGAMLFGSDGANHSRATFYDDSGNIRVKINADTATTNASWFSGSVHLAADSGNVGIGTTAPGYKLDVSGDMHTSGQIYGDGAASNYSAFSVNGAKGGWGGINFRSGSTNLGTLMVSVDTQGFYNDADSGWDWYWTNGTLTSGSIPWGRISSFTGDTTDDSWTGTTNVYETTGNVGIGTTAPYALLQISNTAGHNIRLTSLGHIEEYYMAESNPRWAITRDAIGSGLSAYTLNNSGGSTIAANGVAVGIAADKTLGLYTSNGAALTERVRVDSIGNVGIGTTLPIYKLDVQGGNFRVGAQGLVFDATNNYLAINSNSTSRQLNVASSATGEAVAAQLWNYAPSANNNAVTMEFNAYTAAYASNVHVASLGGMITDNTASAYKGALIFQTSNNASPTEKMRVTYDGNVGIGTTVPLARFQVYDDNGFERLTNGSVEVWYGKSETSPRVGLYQNVPGGAGGPTGQGIAFSGPGGQSTATAGSGIAYTDASTNKMLGFYVSDGTKWAERMRIDSNGNVGIGNTAPASKLSVNSSWGQELSTSGYDVVLNHGKMRISSTEAAVSNNAPTVIDLLGSEPGAYGGIKTSIDFHAYDRGNIVNSGVQARITGGLKDGAEWNGTTAGYLAFATAAAGSTVPTMRLSIDAAGTIGVGSTAPNSVLIQGQAYSGAIMIATNGSVGGDTNRNLQLGHVDNSSIFYPSIFIGGDSGNVGIGTTNPGNYKLYVNGDTYLGGVTVTGGTLSFGGDLNRTGNKITNTSNIAIGASSPGSAGLAVMVGNVGIGTTAPVAELSVAGLINAGKQQSNSNSQYIVSGKAVYNLLSMRANLSNLGGFGMIQDSGYESPIIYGYNYANNAIYFGSMSGAVGSRDLGTQFTTQMVIRTDTGYVGISNTAPDAKLVVGSTGYGGQSKIYVQEGVAGANLSAIYNATYHNDITEKGMHIYGNTAILDAGTTGNIISLQIVGNEKVRINTNGNVGIGTGSPNEKLEVYDTSGSTSLKINEGSGAAGTKSNIKFSNNDGAFSGETARITASTNSGHDTLLQLGVVYHAQSVPTPALTIWGGSADNIGGNVGIGTTTPQALLEIHPATDGNPQIWLSQQNGTVGWNLTADNSGVFRIFRSNTPSSVLSMLYNTGNVGIGTTAPVSKLDVTASADGVGPTLSLRNPFVNGYSPQLNFDAYGYSGSPAGIFSELNIAGAYAGGNGAYISFNVKSQPQSSAIESIRLKGGGDILLAPTSSGYVGIGTTASPGAKLEVTGGVAYVNNLNANELVFNSSGSNWVSFYDPGLTTSNGGIAIGASSAVGTKPSSATMFWNVNTGNVGIGTTNPGNYKLYVNGDTYIGGVTVTGGTLSFGGDLNMKGNKITNASNIGIGESSPGSAALAVITGNVGIGTTAPGAPLHIKNAIFPQLIVEAANAGYHLDLSHTGTINLNTAAANHFDFQRNGSSQMWIDTVGNVGIGTTNPLYKFNVNNYSGNDSYYFKSNGSATMIIDKGSTSAYGHLGFATGGSAKWWLGMQNETTNYFMIGTGQDAVNPPYLTINYTTGNVGIGTTTPLQKLDVSANGGSGPRIRLTNPNATSRNAELQFAYGATPTQGFEIGTDWYAVGGDDLSVGYGGATQIMVFKSGGNVGIGTTNPVYKLHVNGTFNAGTMVASSLTVTGPAYLATTSGNVGVGTIAPGAPLEVYKAGTGAEVTGGGIIIARGPGPTSYRGGAIYSRYFSGAAADALVFGVTTVDNKNPYSDLDQIRMVVLSSGNVGIGTTTPQAPLDFGTKSTGGRPFWLMYNDSAGINMGIWRDTPGANNTGFVTNSGGSFVFGKSTNAATPTFGTEWMRIVNNGSVGIGTTLPGYKLDVNGQVNSSFASTNSGGQFIANNSSASATNGAASVFQAAALPGYNTWFGTTADGTDASYQSSYGSAVVKSQQGIVITNGGGGLLLHAVNGAGIIFATGNTGSERVRFTNTGNVGIGTVGPRQALDVNGNITVAWGETGRIGMDYSDGTGYRNGLSFSAAGRATQVDALTSGSDSAIVFRTGTVGTPSEKMRIQYNGNVGIGTASPLGLLQVGTSPGAGLVVTSGGLVGIGTTIPGFKLQVGTGATSALANKNGIFLADPTATYISAKEGTGPEVFFGSDSTSTYGIFGTLSNHDLGIRANNALAMTIKTGGNVGIGTTAPATNEKLHVMGNMRVESWSGAGYTEGLAINAPTDGINYGILHFQNVATTAANGNPPWMLSFNYIPEASSVRGGGLAFVQNNANTRLYLNSSGNVGIGTTAPGARLETVGIGGTGPVALKVTNGPVIMFGALQTTDSLGNALALTNVYKAQTDGDIMVFDAQTSGDNDIGYGGTANPPTVVLAYAHNSALNTQSCSLFFSVAKDEYVKITADSGAVDHIYWRPVGTGQLVKQ